MTHLDDGVDRAEKYRKRPVAHPVAEVFDWLDRECQFESFDLDIRTDESLAHANFFGSR